jgi:hypothetical protein
MALILAAGAMPAKALTRPLPERSGHRDRATERLRPVRAESIRDHGRIIAISTSPAPGGSLYALVPAMTPLGRSVGRADVADVIGFLAGPDDRWITGQNIHAGGGIA